MNPPSPNDSFYDPEFTPANAALIDVGTPGVRSNSDSLALLTGGLIMLLSASFLRRLSG